MKSVIFAGVSAAALLFAGSALAAGNAATIDQIGFTQTATIDQTGSPSDAVATVHQSNAYNLANVTQGGGSGNLADVTQSQGAFGAVRNPSNISNSNQQGANGGVTVVQVGNNSSTVNQYGGSVGEHALVGQSNNGNVSDIGQSGQNELAVTNQQSGTGNSSTIAQAGTGDGNFSPSAYPNHNHGPNNLVWHENVPNDSVLPGAGGSLTEYGVVGSIVDQVGSNNVGSINQAGFQNFADVSQENDANTGGNTGTIVQAAGMFQSDAVMYQLGQFNVASISQVGAGTSYSTVWQNGNSNQAYSSQTGSNHSAIEQGFTDDAGTTAAGPANNEYASVTQGGGGNLSTVQQLGSNDTATVTQGGANATATINQGAGGSFNTATIHQ
ncbi:MAG: hypothetical protein ACHP9T_09985 [Caulobacterales bacterium]